MTRFRLLRTVAEVGEMVDRMLRARAVAFDTETTGTALHRDAHVIGVAVFVPDDDALPIPVDGVLPPGDEFYVPLRHLVGQNVDDVPGALEALRAGFARPDQIQLAHNLGFDLRGLWKDEVYPGGVLADTMIGAQLLDPHRSNKLKDLARVLLGQTTDEEAALEAVATAAVRTHFPDDWKKRCAGGNWKGYLHYVDPAVVGAYAGADVRFTYALAGLVKKEIEFREMNWINGIEQMLVPEIARMESTGHAVDVALAEELYGETTAARDQILERIRGALGLPELNPGSNDQVLGALTNIRGIKFGADSKRTKTGKISLYDDALEATRDPVALDIVAWRQKNKLAETYFDPIRIAGASGRVHGSIMQCGARTGRMSAYDPNLQNIPTRTAEGKRVREVFIATQGWVLGYLDWSQIELRWFAHYSQEPAMTAAFHSGLDIHQATANEIGRTRPEAKTINFAILYGAGVRKIAANLGLSYADASMILGGYHRKFPGIKTLQARIRNALAERGFIRDYFGRRHYVERGKDYRGLNYLIQGSAAGLFKAALVLAGPIVRRHGGRVLLPIHDEMVFEAPTVDALRTILLEVREAWESIVRLRVPLVADASWSPTTWADKKAAAWADIESGVAFREEAA